MSVKSATGVESVESVDSIIRTIIDFSNLGVSLVLLILIALVIRQLNYLKDERKKLQNMRWVVVNLLFIEGYFRSHLEASWAAVLRTSDMRGSVSNAAPAPPGFSDVNLQQ